MLIVFAKCIRAICIHAHDACIYVRLYSVRSAINFNSTKIRSQATGMRSFFALHKQPTICAVNGGVCSEVHIFKLLALVLAQSIFITSECTVTLLPSEKTNHSHSVELS